MSGVLVDSNVILDVVTDDPHWKDWSSAALARCADEGQLVINPLIYSEVSTGFSRIEELDEVLRRYRTYFPRLTILAPEE